MRDREGERELFLFSEISVTRGASVCYLSKET